MNWTPELQTVLSRVFPTSGVNQAIWLKNNPGARIKQLQIVVISYCATERCKELLKDIRHPIPTRAHIKTKTVGVELAGMTSQLRIFFKQSDAITGFSQCR